MQEEYLFIFEIMWRVRANGALRLYIIYETKPEYNTRIKKQFSFIIQEKYKKMFFVN